VRRASLGIVLVLFNDISAVTQIGLMCGILFLTFLPQLLLNVFDSESVYMQNLLLEFTVMILAFSLFFFELVINTESSALLTG